MFLQFAFGSSCTPASTSHSWRAVAQALVFLPWACEFSGRPQLGLLFNPVVGPLPHWFFALGIMSQPTNILSDPQLAMWGRSLQFWWGIPFFAIHNAGQRSRRSRATFTSSEHRRPRPRCSVSFRSPFPPGATDRDHHSAAYGLDLQFRRSHHRHDQWRAGGPNPDRRSYIFTQAFKRLDFGYASAIALVLLRCSSPIHC